jgi:peptide/nickel transport system permease protein
MGLDRPLPVQYLSWLWSFVRGDWGYSFADGRPVMQRLLERMPATLELVGTSTILGVIVALVVGVVAS